MTDILTDIAKDILGVTTLESRNSDRDDFYDLGVGQIKAALQAAYDAGKQAQYDYARMMGGG